MAKVKLDPGPFVIPMPLVLIGAMVNGKPNFMPAAFVSIANFDPPILACGLSPKHYTCDGISENKAFSLCLPSTDQVTITDYCGIRSGKKEDKSGLFDVYFGENENAPLITDCPVSVECKLVKTESFQVDNVYFGEIVAVHAEESVLTEGKIDWKKIDPLVFTFPDKSYWKLGEYVAPAWKIGKEFKK